MYDHQIKYIGGPLDGKVKWVDEIPATLSPATGVTYYRHKRSKDGIWEYRVKKPKPTK
jgi:hypothetical protein